MVIKLWSSYPPLTFTLSLAFQFLRIQAAGMSINSKTFKLSFVTAQKVAIKFKRYEEMNNVRSNSKVKAKS